MTDSPAMGSVPSEPITLRSNEPGAIGVGAARVSDRRAGLVRRNPRKLVYCMLA